MYTPSDTVLERYADILINYALNKGQGVRKGEVVMLQVEEPAKPLLKRLHKAVLTAGAQPIVQFIPSGMNRQFFDNASDDQLTFFPEQYLKGRLDTINHIVSVIADDDKHELEGIDPKKIMLRNRAYKPYIDMRAPKEASGQLTWTLALYGTKAMADEAGLTEEEYWEQIIRACYLDEQDPVQKWKELQAEITRLKATLDNLGLHSLRVESEGTDLTIGLDADRRWLGATGQNIPSFEVYISPDARRTEGHITFNMPLYRYGTKIEGVFLRFEQGRVVEASATKNEALLKEMIAVEGADRVGEFSLTDKRHSRITRFMGETLYDENVGGEQGNTHLALGMAYKESYPGDRLSVPKERWEEMGYNDSSIHTDIMSTSPRKVTATLRDGAQKVIYENGEFTI